MDVLLLITLMLLTLNPVKSNSDVQVQEPSGYAGQSTSFFLMQHVFKLEGKVETKLKHMEEDIEELKSKAINQEGNELREDIGEIKSEMENLSQELKSAKSELLDSNSALKQETIVLQEKISDLQSAISRMHTLGTTGLCPKSWILFRDTCYMMKMDRMNWTLALVKCRDEGGYLAEIDNEAEGQFIKEEAMLVQDSFWLGGSDIVREGDWQWVTSKKKISDGSYTDWKAGKADNYWGKEHCLTIVKGFQYRWNDAPCEMESGYICEMQI